MTIVRPAKGLSVRSSPGIGRGAVSSPGNRFERIQLELELSEDGDYPARKIPTQFFDDDAKTIISSNSSPDIPFRFSINPYRGCEHGCAYCYARPTHETLGLNAGIDFESKILVKRRLQIRLRDELNHPHWKGEKIVLSGVTDCYQPAERYFRLTRQILEVFQEANQAYSIITKNRLITRDVDLLGPAAQLGLVHTFISITSLDQELARQMEPRTATPAARLKTIADLAEAGVPVGVMVAPIIPALNDVEVPRILAAARQAGASAAAYLLLRLPMSVLPVFERWLAHHRSEAFDRVVGRVRDCREGALNSSKFGQRMSGTGAYAETISNTFATFSRSLGLDQPLKPLDTSRFTPPRAADGQQSLF